MKNPTLDDARAAKAAAHKAFEAFAPVVGVGITQVGESYAVKINLAHPPKSAALMPAEINGVPVVVEIVGRITKQAAE